MTENSPAMNSQQRRKFPSTTQYTTMATKPARLPQVTDRDPKVVCPVVQLAASPGRQDKNPHSRIKPNHFNPPPKKGDGHHPSMQASELIQKHILSPQGTHPCFLELFYALALNYAFAIVVPDA